jgi:hypothetical protein
VKVLSVGYFLDPYDPLFVPFQFVWWPLLGIMPFCLQSEDVGLSQWGDFRVRGKLDVAQRAGICYRLSKFTKIFQGAIRSRFTTGYAMKR